MGVGVQGEPGAVMAQHPRDGLYVHPVLQSQSCEGVSQIMEPDLRQSRPFQHPVEHVEHTVRRHGAAPWAREYPGACSDLLFLLIQNVYRILCQRQGAVGVFCFQGSLHHLTVDSCYLPFNPEAAPFQIKVLPLEPQQFSPPQAGGQLHVIELEHSALFRLPQEGGQLLHRQGFHLPVLHLRQGATFRWVG